MCKSHNKNSIKMCKCDETIIFAQKNVKFIVYSLLFVYNIFSEYILEVNNMYLKRKIDTYLIEWKNRSNSYCQCVQ